MGPDTTTGRLWRAGLIGLMMIGSWLSFMGCAGRLPPNLSIEGRLAVYGRQVIITANGVLTSVDIITEQRLGMVQLQKATRQLDDKTAYERSEQIKADARLVIGIIGQIGSAGQSLADALRVIDQTADPGQRNTAIDTARNLILAIQRLLTEGQVKIGDDQTRRSAIGLLSQITDLLLNLALVMPQPVAAKAGA